MDTITRLMAQMMVDNCPKCSGSGHIFYEIYTVGGDRGGLCPSCTPLREELECPFDELRTSSRASMASDIASQIEAGVPQRKD